MNSPKAAKLSTAYVTGVVLAGGSLFAYALRQLYLAPIDNQWFILVGLTILTGSFTVPMSPLPVRVSVSETFVFASVLLFGTPAGTVTVVLESLVTSLWAQPQKRRPLRILFNPAAAAVAIWLSGSAFYSLSGIRPYINGPTPLPILLIPLVGFTASYFLLNSWLVAFAVALNRNRSPLSVWWPQFTWISVNYFSGASAAALIVTYRQRIDSNALLIIVPLLVISYLTFRTAMGRANDATEHLAQLNKLYLSTIETLAMAIDAKDQITHGHIRRVQAYAVGLARRVGISDDRSIRAIEAAALLHDMGKLAVPEYILNKPGKLTPAEFEKMKLHASVGADILSAIDFPYPVVPIVRHHHEQWNGGGYPDGIKGTDIPIGARILSVVDCFDALTSDRPYRPRLSDDDALKILIERRGLMYDPLIVDTFIRVYKEIAPDPSSSGPSRQALNEITSSSHSVAALSGNDGLDEIAASGDEMLTLYELAAALAGHSSAINSMDLIEKYLHRLIPFSLCILYTYERDTDELKATHGIGEGASAIVGMRLSLGQRLSGWVAANRQTIVNSDPVLDLGDFARGTNPRLRSCLSSPLVFEDELIGVIALYSSRHNNFSEDHRRVIEAVARQVANMFKRIAAPFRSDRQDRITGLAELHQLERLTDPRFEGRFLRTPAPILLHIDINRLRMINDCYGHEVGDDAVRHVADCLRRQLRPDDFLFRYVSDEFVAVLNMPPSDYVANFGRHVIRALRNAPLRLTDGTNIELNVSVSHVRCSPSGESVQQLVAAALSQRFMPSVGRDEPRIH